MTIAQLDDDQKQENDQPTSLEESFIAGFKIAAQAAEEEAREKQTEEKKEQKTNDD